MLKLNIFRTVLIVFLTVVTVIAADEGVIKADIEKLADKAAGKLSETGTTDQSIAIADFDNKTRKAKESNMGHAVSEVVTERFKKFGKFVVIENRQISKIMAQMELEQTGLYDSKKTAAIGNLVGAKLMIVGSVSEIGGFYNVSLRVVRIETGEVMVTESKEIPITTMESVAALYKPADYRIFLGGGLFGRNFTSGVAPRNGAMIYLGGSYKFTGNHTLIGLGAYCTGYDTTAELNSKPAGAVNASAELLFKNSYSFSAGYGYEFALTRILSLRPALMFGYSFQNLTLNEKYLVVTAIVGPTTFYSSTTNSSNISFNAPYVSPVVNFIFMGNSPISFNLEAGANLYLQQFTFTGITTSISTTVIDWFVRGGIGIYI